jgi:ribonucleoside-diphosphate reductase alpha chain
MLTFAQLLPSAPTPANRTVEVREGANVKFRAENIDAPITWSDSAVSTMFRIWARRLPGETGVQHRHDERTGQLQRVDGYESSVYGMVDRVAGTIADEGLARGYFNGDQRTNFYQELSRLFLNQYGLLNTPAWINIGASPNPQASACFILGVEDSLESLRHWQDTETRLFSAGSGAGADLSLIRPENFPLSGGGTASGPVSFARGTDSWAGVTKSGGKCLAPYQKVYTEQGPIAVADLAKRASFITLSFDPPSGRFKAKRAHAWLSGEKQVIRVKTDKGSFDLSADHPMRLSTGEYVKAGDLKIGTSLFSCAIDYGNGYVRVHLKNGRKGKDLFHRMIVRDVLNRDIDELSVHHADENKLNNDPANLEVLTPAEHSRHHGNEAVANGTCHFQHVAYPKCGDANPMHRSNDWWETPEADRYKEKQGRILAESGRAQEMQKASAEQKMLNTLYRLICAGYDVSTEDKYIEARQKEIGRIPSIPQLRRKITAHFGSYDNFREEARRNNHQVIGVEIVGVMPVFDVEVDCPTKDDHSPASGHNFVIWSGEDRFGSGIVVSNSRRAAKMLTIHISHPDARKFIIAKRDSQRRSHTLIDAGYSGAWQSDAWQLEPFQNANLSVRVDDAFMDAVETGSDYALRFDGKTVETVKARELWDLICDCTWESGDPGLQFDTTINRWNTVPNWGRIVSSNPCSEYLHPNDSACNLASLNLCKFLRPDGSFDIPLFQHCVRLLIVAQDIIVGFAGYPTDKIAANSVKYRPLGLGYCNLGAFLMRQGLGYDSDEGRELAACITALMGGTAYAASGELAQLLGPFAGFERNADAMRAVMSQHVLACEALPHNELGIAAAQSWETADAYQQWRNSQATVLAPTGTIGIVMDADTTGLEPEYDLVTYKTLAGGGMARRVSGSVPAALWALGWGEESVAKAVAELEQTGKFPVSRPSTSENTAAGLRSCLATAAGQWPLSPSAHIRMMAAVQPFLSGGTSKTVNLPKSAQVGDVMDAYALAWKLGVKSVAVYRDGSKRSQPLNNGTSQAPSVKPMAERTADERRATEVSMEDAGTDVHTEGYKKLVKDLYGAGPSRPLPDDRRASNHKLTVAGQDLYLTLGYYDDGAIGEMFLTLAKEGSAERALLGALCQAVSVGLQYGVPLDKFLDKWQGTRFDPAGFTGREDIRSATSPLDLVAKKIRKLLEEVREPFDVVRGVDQPLPLVPIAEATALPLESLSPCCGATYRTTGTCKTCSNCGATSGGCG